MITISEFSILTINLVLLLTRQYIQRQYKIIKHYEVKLKTKIGFLSVIFYVKISSQLVFVSATKISEKYKNNVNRKSHRNMT